MRGFPRYLNTRADYDLVLRQFPPEKRERDFFGELIADSKKYFEVRVLADGEKITPTATQMIVEEVDPGTNKKVSRLLELMPDPNCKLARLGMDEAEVKAVSDETANAIADGGAYG